MIRQIAPEFFTTEMAATLAYYQDKLGFDCVGTWHDPPVYAIVAREDGPSVWIQRQSDRLVLRSTSTIRAAGGARC